MFQNDQYGRGKDITVNKKQYETASDIEDTQDRNNLHTDIADGTNAAQYHKTGDKGSGNAYQMGRKPPGGGSGLCEGVGLRGTAYAESGAYSTERIEFCQRFVVQAVFEHIHRAA